MCICPIAGSGNDSCVMEDKAFKKAVLCAFLVMQFLFWYVFWYQNYAAGLMFYGVFQHSVNIGTSSLQTNFLPQLKNALFCQEVFYLFAVLCS